MSSSVNAPYLKTYCENHEKCMQMIQAVLDGSATPEEFEHYKKSISECMPCIEGYELEKSIKEALNQKVQRKCCPQNTISTIKTKIGLGLALVGLVCIQIKIFQVMVEI